MSTLRRWIADHPVESARLLENGGKAMKKHGHTVQAAIRCLKGDGDVYAWDNRNKKWRRILYDDGGRHLHHDVVRSDTMLYITPYTVYDYALSTCTDGPDGGPCEFCASCPHLDNDLPEPLHEGCKVWPLERFGGGWLRADDPETDRCVTLGRLPQFARWTGVYGYEECGEIVWTSNPRMRKSCDGILLPPDDECGHLVYPDYVEMETGDAEN